MAQLRSYRVSQRFWKREMIAALRFGAFVGDFQGDGSHNSPEALRRPCALNHCENDGTWSQPGVS
jgi:hypothetical protein